MRTLEVAFVFFLSASIIVSIAPPVYGGESYAQDYVLANDILISLYKSLGERAFFPEHKEDVISFLDAASEELSLCIALQTEAYAYETCPIEEGAFIERSVGRKVLLGVGK